MRRKSEQDLGGACVQRGLSADSVFSSYREQIRALFIAFTRFLLVGANSESTIEGK
jgi:hypothetical protein